MSLQEQLSTLKAKNIANHPREKVDVLLEETEKLDKSGIVDRAQKAGEKIKDFTLPNQLGEQRRLAAIRADGPVVISFYRGGWCPYCNLELRAYQQVLPEIKAAGATLVAITPELPTHPCRPQRRTIWSSRSSPTPTRTTPASWGWSSLSPSRLRPIYEEFGIDVEKHNGQGQFDLPLAATFVVNTDGTIVCAAVGADYTERAEPADVVKALQSLTKQPCESACPASK